MRDIAARRVPWRRRQNAERWAVDDVNLEVCPGEAVGLIGGNGAGKSTLLRIASGLTRPTRGTVQVPAGTTAVLSLGEAFALDLTGIENAVTTAIVSGFSPKRARELLPTILEYAELEDAAHAPVRTYSEGMKLRLAFAVVAQLRPPALLLDEVMSVGDASFQAKSNARIEQALKDGTAVLMASHDLGRMRASCDRVLWLKHGKVRAIGAPDEVITAYEQEMMDETYRRTSDGAVGGGPAKEGRVGSQEVSIDRVVLQLGGETGMHPTAAVGSAMSLKWAVSGIVDRGLPPAIAVVIEDQTGATVCSITSVADGIAVPAQTDQHEMSLELDRLDLVPGTYRVQIGVYRGDWKYAYDLHVTGYPFTLVGPSVAHGVLSPPRRWGTA